MASACVVLLMGLPGSGKSTLCDSLISCNNRRNRNGKYLCENGDLQCMPSEAAHNATCNTPTAMGEVSEDICLVNKEVAGELVSVSGDHICKHGAMDISEPVSDLNETQGMGDYTFLHVCYDDLIPDKLQVQLTETSSEESVWKSYRRNILHCVRHLLLTHLGKSDSIQCLHDDVCQKLHEKLDKNNVHVCQGKLILLIDDNMYYKSMRYQYYQLCRQMEISFCQVYIKCKLNDALRNNQQRRQRVPDDVIIKMAERIEEPDPKESWENNCLIWQIGDHVNNVVSHVCEALANPLRDTVAEAETIREHSRIICSQSVLHQVDKILRKFVSESLLEAKNAGKSAQILKYTAGRANRSRTSVMAKLKSGQIQLNVDQDGSIDDRNVTSDLYDIIKVAFVEEME